MRARSPRNHFLSTTFLLVVSLAISLALSASAFAATTYETVGTFGGTLTKRGAGEEWPEKVQLGAVSGLAVNRTGAGGVPKGTVFAAMDTAGDANHAGNFLPAAVARFSPTGAFEETFTPGNTCGPIVSGSPECPVRVSGSPGGTDVDIDQTTGNVYLLHAGAVGEPSVTVFSPDGSEVITQFALRGKFGETSAEGPEKLHATSSEGLAVGAAGEVYVFDEDNPSDFHRRLMVFKPETPGDYEHYVYSGEVLGKTPSAPYFPAAPTLDDAGHIYVSGDEFIAEYNLSKSANNPVCTFNIGSGITSFAVNPATGEVFYYNSTNKRVHVLNPCNAEGKFVETEPAFKQTPERDFLTALTFDPQREFSTGRPAGVLYGAAPNGENSGGIGGEAGTSALGYIFTRPISHAPTISSESVSNVTMTSAILHAAIDPKGSQTKFVFQYVPTADWEANEPSNRFAGAVEVPVGGANLGSGQGALPASAALSGLVPASEYHYRVVATSSEGSATGPDQVFRTYFMASPGPPDGRAYEQVSPVQKNGGQVRPLSPSTASCGQECKPGLVGDRFPVQVSPSGDSIAYQGQPFRLNEGPTEYDENIARRTEAGWATVGLGPSSPRLGFFFQSDGLVADLSKGVIGAMNPPATPDAPPNYQNLFIQSMADPSALEPLLTAAPPNRSGENPDGTFDNNRFIFEYAGASQDLSHIFFKANDALTTATAVAPAAPDPGASGYNLYEWSGGNLRLVNVAPGNAAPVPGATFGAAAVVNSLPNFSHAISADGSRVFWSDAAGQVYVRENAEATREIPVAGKFLGASADGSEVLLSSGRIYNLETEATTDVTEGKGGFLGLAAQTEDLSRLYFVSTSVLDETPNAFGSAAEAGKDNLYVRADGSSRYVATLTGGDAPNGGNGGVWEESPMMRRAEASPSGRWFAFQSLAPVTGKVSTGPCVTNGGLPAQQGTCPEVFLYDLQTGSLICASCNPAGAAPLGYSTVPVITKGARGYLQQVQYLTDSGRLFFDTEDSLSPFDSNNGAEDVYEFEPSGIGSCSRSGGCISLISAGREASDSNFYATDATGKNVFFTTRDQLVSQDKDDLIDLYDARENGGFPPEAEAVSCRGDACQPQVSPPSEIGVGSSSVSGGGNVVARKHHKGKYHKRHKKKHHKHHKGKSNKRNNHGGAK